MPRQAESSFRVEIRIAADSLLPLLLAHNFSAAYNAKYGMGPAGTMLIARRKSLQLPFSVIESVSFLPKSKAEEFILRLKKKETENTGSIFWAKKEKAWRSGLTGPFVNRKRAHLSGS